jgi:hypothetical protein
LGPGFLDDVIGAHVRGDQQRIDRVAIRIQFGFDHHRLAIHRFNRVNIVDVGGAGRGVVLDVGGPGVGDIFGGHRRAIAPLRGRLNLEGEFSPRVVPGKVAISQQRILLAVEHVVQIRGFKHGDAGIVLLGDHQSIVVAVGVGIPTDYRAPLLSVEIQGFVAGQRVRINRGCGGDDLHNLRLCDDLGFPDNLGFSDRDHLGLDNYRGRWRPAGRQQEAGRHDRSDEVEQELAHGDFLLTLQWA